MFRLSYQLYRLSSGLRYVIPRRFTPAGLLALVALVVSGAIGVDMDKTVAFQGFALVLCLLCVAIIAGLFFRGRFSAQRWLPRFGSVGQPLIYLVTVENRSRRRQHQLEVLENLADPRPSLAEFVAEQREELRVWRRRFKITTSTQDNRPATTRPAPLPSLQPTGQAEARLEVLPLKRGPLRFSGLTIAKTDPFGWFRGFVRIALPQTVMILPRRYPLPAINLDGTRQYQPGGVALAAAIGESEEFVSLRDYRPGDPKRHIHWRSWARLGRPIVKEFEDEFLVRHALILDTFAQPGKSGAFEEAISVAASFACTLNTQESLLDLLFVGTRAVCFTTGRGLGQAEQALEILASVAACQQRPFADLQELVLRHAGTACGCIAILLDWDEPRRELVRRLRVFGIPTLILIVAVPAEAEKIRRAPADEKPERFHVLEVGKIGEDLLKVS